jgi:hypothetical protein
MSFKEITAENGVVYMSSDNISAVHGFTTRYGGVSKGIFESLNLGEHRGDSEENVRENYRLLSEALGLKNLVFTKQVHGNIVKSVTSEDAHTLFSPVPYEADGLVTNEPDVALVIFTADCIPILLHDPVKGAIGAVHAGWRGTVADIAGEGVRKMQSEFGCDPGDIHVSIGPGIGRCCFETGMDVPTEVFSVLLATGGTGRPDDYLDVCGNSKFKVDLKAVNRILLTRAGVLPENIDISDECTKCLNEKYWSHRHTGGERGSQASVIMLKGK